jgi:chromosome partition protein MukB
VTRVRAQSLALVNWKGVFYERYSLDEHVTALEGDNGAGKTTVMIAAYVAMLPDMARLRFTNVGEGDSTGGDKGIWGRLGDPNRPSYTVVAFELTGEYVLAGVHLERKGEPSVELTPFLISELAPGIALQEVLLLRSSDGDFVPELSDLRENVTRLGGRMEVFRTAREYFAALFERGIMPLRLGAEEERSRFNDMLRTSMTGGISRALTSEFRSFLLKAESGLADTLIRMRANLDACRRTRTEVNEAQALEKEISAVHEAGSAMFAAALLATRERAEELRRRLEEATEKRDAALFERDAVERECAAQVLERDSLVTRLTTARAEHEGAQRTLDQVTAANQIAKRINALDAQLLGLRDGLEIATTAMKRAEQSKLHRLGERGRAEENYRLAAAGLADLRAGLEELHRRADAHRTVMRRLEEARAALGIEVISVEDIGAHELSTQALITEIDQSRSELDATLGGAQVHAKEHARTMRSLSFILEQEVDAIDAHARARMAIRNLSDLEAIAERARSIEEGLQQNRMLLQRQREVQARAQELSLSGGVLASAQDVVTALQCVEADVRGVEDQARGHDSQAEDCRRSRQALRRKDGELQTRAVRWRELDTVASRLEATLGAGLRTGEELEAARQILDEARDAVQGNLDSLRTTRTETIEKARNLEQSGGLFHPDLLVARDFAGGELLASHFDEIDPQAAGQIQARLGPLADAIVVEDARVAAHSLAGRVRELDTIWFVEAGALHDVVAQSGEDTIEAGSKDVIVEQPGIARTTRVPAMPTLGSKARQRLIVQLHSQADELLDRIGAADTQLSEIRSNRTDTALLTRELATLSLGDPAAELAQVSVQMEDLRCRLDEHVESARETWLRAGQLSQRANKLRTLLGDSFLLDEPDLSLKVEELANAWRSVIHARGELVRVADARHTLIDKLETLRRLPLSLSEQELLRAQLEQLSERRTGLFLALDALGYVLKHRHALDWGEAECTLAAQQDLVPALSEQCETANQEQQRAIAAAVKADEAWEYARVQWRSIDDSRNALAVSREQAQADLKEKGVEDPSDGAVLRARESTERLSAVILALDTAERRLAETIAQLAERLTARQRSLTEAQERWDREDREWRPADELWERLRAKAVTHRLLTPGISTRLLNVGTGSVNLRSDARTWAKALEERLSKAKGGKDVLEQIRALQPGQDQTTGEDSLQIWIVTRDWLRRRVPSQIAEVDDPQEALERLRRHLSHLGERLNDQEQRLRGASEDVARGIDVHIRSAQRQVKQLNLELEGVRFGTIRSMQIRLSRDDRMEAILGALREGSAQDLLFAPTMPVEDALEALLARFGGRGMTVGQKLLDYREYVDIAVEIQRQASADWERVNPARLSTGEAIGVGTALMMVVLTAWERSANLFRAKRSMGTLRFLFLDEANRLSQDNLQVLFELCKAVELQLLIAAPEVARAVGCTTYRLVRRATADGAEEVLVTGRRAVAGE